MSTRSVLLLAVCLLIAAPGCSKQSTSPVRAALSISPADGAAGVRLDAPITLEFGRPVDRSIVERSFHLLSEASMKDSLCLADSMTTMDMTTMMADGRMMSHMLQAHSIPGSFQWNGTAECIFSPDSGMTPDTRYMIHLGNEMLGMMGGAAMGGHDAGSGSMALHFTTLEASSHDGHH